MAKDTLIVGFLGGALTEGKGASDPKKTSWRAKISAWMEKSLGSSMNVVTINAAMGGTGSEFAAFRLQDHLLNKKVPDLCFVEFGVDDDGYPEEVILRSMDGIVQQLVAANPEIRIYFINTTKRAYEPFLEKKAFSPVFELHYQVAEHYGIEAIRLGQPLYRAVKEREGNWEALLPDGIHPNDDGYQIYFETIRDFLANENRTWAEPKKKHLNEPFTEQPNVNGRLLDATRLGEFSGWSEIKKPLPGKRYPRYLEGHRGSEPLKFKFSGNKVGLFWLISREGGSVTTEIDRANAGTFNAWDPKAIRAGYAGYQMISDDLPDGEHELVLSIKPEGPGKPEKSLVRIAAFLVG